MFALIALLATLHLTATANHKTFTVKPQTAIVVTLPWKPRTGYHWKYRQSAGSGNVVYLTSIFEFPPKKGSPPGAAGREVWHFRALGKGRAVMHFLDFPPGSSSKPVKRIGITIHVR